MVFERISKSTWVRTRIGNVRFALVFTVFLKGRGFRHQQENIEKGVKKLRVGIKPETRVIARGNTKIFNNENKEIGKITSGTFGPSVECSIAMGYVDNGYSSLNTKIFLEVRGKKVPANICNLPFYKKNYVKGEINVRN